MSEHHNDNFEDLFKKGAEHEAFEYNPNDWLDLKEKLDRDKRKRILWLYLGYGLATFGVLAALLFCFNTFKDSTHSDAEVIRNEGISDLHIDAKNESNTLEVSESALGESISQSASEPSDNQSITNHLSNDATSSSQSLNSLNGRQNNRSKAIGTALKNKTLIEKSSFSQPSGHTINEHGSNVSTYEDRQILTNDNINRYTQAYTPLTSKRKTNEVFVLSRMNALSISPFAISQDIDFDMEMADIQPIEKMVERGLMLSIGIGQDWSSVGMSSIKGGDTRYGVGASYFVSSKLGFSTGASYISDSYAAAGDTYSPYMGYWAKQSVPDRIDAKCNMIEIPLGITYYPKSFKENGFMANAHMLTVLMLDQQYDYWYTEDNPEFKKGWKSNSIDQDYFSQLKLAIGYQHFISEKMALQVSPYANLPVATIGFGNVKLSSFGVEMRITFGKL